MGAAFYLAVEKSWLFIHDDYNQKSRSEMSGFFDIRLTRSKAITEVFSGGIQYIF
jgi:hypothetical protein